MSKKYFLTLPDGLAKYLDEQAKKIGVTPLNYILHLVIKDKEQNDEDKYLH